METEERAKNSISTNQRDKVESAHTPNKTAWIIGTVVVVIVLVLVVVLCTYASKTSDLTTTGTTGSAGPTTGPVQESLVQPSRFQPSGGEWKHPLVNVHDELSDRFVFQGFPSIHGEVFGSGDDQHLRYQNTKGSINLNQDLEALTLSLDSCRLFTNGFRIRTRELSLKNASIFLGSVATMANVRRENESNESTESKGYIENHRSHAWSENTKSMLLSVLQPTANRSSLQSTTDLIAAQQIYTDSQSFICKNERRHFVLVTQTPISHLSMLRVEGPGTTFLID